MAIQLDMVVPTRGSEDVTQALDALSRAVTAHIMATIPGYLRETCWVRIVAITDLDLIAEIKGLPDSEYYRLAYTRDESGTYTFGAPERVKEVTTYQPVEQPLASPPVGMARAVLCDLSPVHAPVAEGLVAGREVQIMRVGPLYDLDSGDFVIDVTDDLCHAIVTSASAVGYGIPIDYGHSLYRAQAAGTPHDGVTLYGRILGLDARAGEGLYGVPEWSPAGLAKLAENPGLLYLSPTLMGSVHSPTTGELLPGRGLHSVSLTPTPRQDHMGTVALSREVQAGGNEAKEVGMAGSKNDEVVTLSRDDHATLLAKIATAEGRVTELAAQLEHKGQEVVTLTAKVATLESEKVSRDFADLVKSHDHRGVVVSDDLRATLSKLPIEQATVILTAMPATRPMTAMGTGGEVTPPRELTEEEIASKAYALMTSAKAEGKSVTYMQAVGLARKGN